MLDIKYIRENLDRVTSRLKLRGPGFSEDLELLVELDVRRRTALKQSETLKNKKKSLSAEVGKLKKEGNDAGLLMEEVKTINARIKQFDDEFRDVENKIRDKLLRIPNLPDEKAPEGSDETQNEILRHWGEKPEFAFEPKSHVELGEKGGLLDLKRAAKIAGARFAVFKGQGAQLLRALINFMMDVQTTENGYQEIYPPRVGQ